MIINVKKVAEASNKLSELNDNDTLYREKAFILVACSKFIGSSVSYSITKKEVVEGLDQERLMTYPLFRYIDGDIDFSEALNLGLDNKELMELQANANYTSVNSLKNVFNIVVNHLINFRES